MRIRLLGLLIFLASWVTLHGQTSPVEIGVALKPPFRFVAFGDTRFTDPTNYGAANDEVRKTLVKGIANAHPDFISIGGDIVYNGYDPKDWKVWDEETAPWRDKHITVYPALGNHDLNGDENTALANYFERFPYLQRSRYYSVKAGNTMTLVLDSSLDETSGPQGEWFEQKLDALPPDTDFVFVVLHHPPYTASSTHDVLRGGGHSAREREKKLAALLESRQPKMHAQIVVFAGHVHNYERYERNGVTYFVTGGGGAHPYYIPRKSGDPLYGLNVNYHYLLVEVGTKSVKITMNRVEMDGDNGPKWTQPDSVTIQAK